MCGGGGGGTKAGDTSQFFQPREEGQAWCSDSLSLIFSTFLSTKWGGGTICSQFSCKFFCFFFFSLKETGLEELK